METVLLPEVDTKNAPVSPKDSIDTHKAFRRNESVYDTNVFTNTKHTVRFTGGRESPTVKIKIDYFSIVYLNPPLFLLSK